MGETNYLLKQIIGEEKLGVKIITVEKNFTDEQIFWY